MFTVQADAYTAKLQNNNEKYQQGVIYLFNKIMATCFMQGQRQCSASNFALQSVPGGFLGFLVTME